MKFLTGDLVSSAKLILCAAAISIILCLSSTEAEVILPESETIPAVIVFGDSIVDPGNNNNLNTAAKCNFPPYGKDFVGGLATGRFSNGKIPPDIIAEELGVKELLPAYLDSNLQVQDLLTGVSFASGGAGFDPLSAELASAYSLSDQLEMFKKYIGQLKEAVGEERTQSIISKSLILVCAGSNDISNVYFGTPFRRLHYDVQSYTDLMANYASSFIQGIYEVGGRRVGIIGAPPIGCVPSQRTIAGGLERKCADTFNEAAMLFNSKLSSQINTLNKKLPQARIAYLDIYTPFIDILQKPAQYGFKVVNRGCCGTGTIESTFLCNRYTVTCANVSNYLFWDSYHPTEKAYKILVPPLVRKVYPKLF